MLIVCYNNIDIAYNKIGVDTYGNKKFFEKYFYKE